MDKVDEVLGLCGFCRYVVKVKDDNSCARCSLTTFLTILCEICDEIIKAKDSRQYYKLKTCRNCFEAIVEAELDVKL